MSVEGDQTVLNVIPASHMVSPPVPITMSISLVMAIGSLLSPTPALVALLHRPRPSCCASNYPVQCPSITPTDPPCLSILAWR